MPTERIVVVDPLGGGDYTTLNSAEAGERAIGADLVSRDEIMIFECKSGGNLLTSALLFPTTWVTDDTRYIQVRAAAGHGHEGKWDTAFAYLEGGVAGDCITSSTQHLRLKRLQCRSQDLVGSDACIELANNSETFFAEECILRGGVWVIYPSSTTKVWKSVQFDSCAMYGSAAYAINYGGAGAGAAGWKLRNCTVIGENYALRGVGANVVFNTVNCYLRGTTAATLMQTGSTANLSATCATSDATAPTAALQNIAYDTNNFVNVTADSEDLHIPTDSALENAGADADMPTTDFEGGERRNTADIGADDPEAPPDSLATAQAVPMPRNIVPVLQTARRAGGFFV